MPLPATEALRLILAVVPWIVDHPGTPVAEVAERFGRSEEQLLGAIGVISLVGLPPYSPDVLIEMRIDEGRIWIDFADYFSRPLRLSTRQALALLSSADGLLSVPGNDPQGSLATAFAKIASVVGAADGGLDVHLGAASDSVIESLNSAVAAGTEVQIDYFSFGRNETSTRVVSPWRVYADGGEWYMSGWCESADGERTFRVDRISDITDTGTLSSNPAPTESRNTSAVRYRPSTAENTVTLELQPAASWVVESVPCLEVEELRGGKLKVSLAVSEIPWLERLLLQLGPDAKVLATSLAGGRGLRSTAALRILAGYGE